MTSRMNIGAVLLVTLACACGSTQKTTPSSDHTSAAMSKSGANITAAREQLEGFAKDANDREMQTGHCPDLNELVATAKDPWGNPIAYMNQKNEEGGGGGSAFVSAGPDGNLLTADDITVSVHCSE